MSKSVPSEGKLFPRGGPGPGATLDRLASFRFTYVAIFAFLLLYVFSVEGMERVLERRFRDAVAAAASVDPGDGPVAQQIPERIDRLVRHSPWVRVGGVRVIASAFGADGTALYVHGPRQAPAATFDPLELAAQAELLLPATTDVVVAVPHNSLLANAFLVGYAALLVVTLFRYNRRLARAEEQRLEAALAAREAAARRAEHIERELAEVQQRLVSQVEAAVPREEIRALHEERAALLEKLETLSRREEALRARAGKAQALDEDRQALEELLDEAVQDLSSKDEEIRSLEARLRRAARAQSASRGAREAEQLARRFRALYRNLEFDDRAIQDLVALREEGMKLKAEESIKRLSEDADSAAVRRKVGGLPPHLSIFELGFAGKGRIYFQRGRQRRHRVLAVGAKNTQKTDLEYLSRLPKED